MTNNSTFGLSTAGIIPPIVVDMVSTCCAYCKSHGQSYVDFGENVTLVKSKLYNDMIEKISHEIDFSFPVYGVKGELE